MWLRCEVKCKKLFIDTYSKVTLPNCFGGTPVCPSRQGVIVSFPFFSRTMSIISIYSSMYFL